MLNLRLSSLHMVAYWILHLILLTPCPVTAAQDVRWIRYPTDQGIFWFDDLRKPALYTGTFADCQGDSLVDLTHFDAALYKDNMTVTLHLQGTTKMQNERVIMGISVYAYGETRLNMMINPCTIDAPSFCQMKPDTPLIANGLVPIGADNLADVPDVAYAIPDFEGQAVLRFYAAENQTQLACYVASMTNGNTMSHPRIVGAVLALFTVIAMISSVAVAVYGDFMSEIRMHHAHTVSVFVIFSVFQHIFFTGALSVNWPSVLPAFWSNFAWAAGMIHNKGMQTSLNSFAQGNFGNISIISGTPANANYTNLGGYYDAAALLQNTRQGAEPVARVRSLAEQQLSRRDTGAYDQSTGFFWYGDRVMPGLPLPGNYSGFAGTLSKVSIPVSNAFLTGSIWFAILLLITITSLVILRFIVVIPFPRRWQRSQRWENFRIRWMRYVTFSVLRSCFIALFMMTVLANFQFVVRASTGSIAIAAAVFALMLLAVIGISAYALWYRLRTETFSCEGDRLYFGLRKWGLSMERGSTRDGTQNKITVYSSIPWFNIRFTDPADRPHVHEDGDYLTKFGWLSARFRRSRWWCFALWAVYELTRACLIGGAAGNAMVQIPLVLVWDIFAFIVMVKLRPFESGRLNLIMIYLLGASKILTTALSLAFLPRFALGRILATVVGVIIIVVQSLLTISLLVTLLLGVASAFVSITRHKEDARYKSQRWLNFRSRYLDNIRRKATDERIPPPPSAPAVDLEESKELSFAVSTVRRLPKIQDGTTVHEVRSSSGNDSADGSSLTTPDISIPNTVRSSAGRIHPDTRLSGSTVSSCSRTDSG